MANFGFDVAEVEVSERGDFEVMPEGEYTLKATDAEIKDTKKGDGNYLAVTFEVTKGSHTGRKVWQNFNLNNPSDKAQSIGREQVAGWARAAGKPNAKDSDDLLERNFQCKLIVEKGTGGYKDNNRIGSFLTGEAKSAPAVSKPASKFDDEPAPAKKAPEPKEDKPKEEPKASAAKNPWD